MVWVLHLWAKTISPQCDWNYIYSRMLWTVKRYKTNQNKTNKQTNKQQQQQNVTVQKNKGRPQQSHKSKLSSVPLQQLTDCTVRVGRYTLGYTVYGKRICHIRTIVWVLGLGLDTSSQILPWACSQPRLKAYIQIKQTKGKTTNKNDSHIDFLGSVQVCTPKSKQPACLAGVKFHHCAKTCNLARGQVTKKSVQQQS